MNASTFDVIIVGTRAAGASLAINLVRKGLRVLAVDRARFPSDTLSTHVIYPNTLARLEALGVLDEIEAHRPPPLYTAWHHQGRAVVAPHAPVNGRDWALCVRRITLDAILVNKARSLGCVVLEGMQVVSLLGSGTSTDPVTGIVCQGPDGEERFSAPLVVGADGVNSTMARCLGLERKKVMPSETMLYFAYWKGAKSRNTQDFFFAPPWICAHFPADDDHHVVTMNGPVNLRNSISDMEAFYLERIQSIPALWARLEGATKVSRVLGSTKLEGFYRQHTGAGWALVGDAAHFKHPAGAQGICDALHASEALSTFIVNGDWPTAYPEWRERESREIYAFCKHLAEVPTDSAVSGLMDCLIHDAPLAKRMVDIWARASSPWKEVIPHVPGMAEITGHSVDEVLAPFDNDVTPTGETV